MQRALLLSNHYDWMEETDASDQQPIHLTTELNNRSNRYINQVNDTNSSPTSQSVRSDLFYSAIDPSLPNLESNASINNNSSDSQLFSSAIFLKTTPSSSSVSSPRDNLLTKSPSLISYQSTETTFEEPDHDDSDTMNRKSIPSPLAQSFTHTRAIPTNIHTDSSPNTVIPLSRDPRVLLLPLALTIGIALSLKAFGLVNTQLEFVGQRGVDYKLTRGWCILADMWFAAVMFALAAYHVFDSLNIYVLFPYRSMGRKQYPESGRCFNANIAAYLSLLTLLIANGLWWIYTQQELQDEWILVGFRSAKWGRQVNIGVYVLLSGYSCLLLLAIGLVIRMRLTVVTFDQQSHRK